MGLSSSIGLALAQPKTVISIDGDGSVLTNLGTLPTTVNNGAAGKDVGAMLNRAALDA